MAPETPGDPAESSASLELSRLIPRAGNPGKPPPFALLEKLPKRVAYLRAVRARQARPAREVEIRILPAGTPPGLEALFRRELDALVALDDPRFLPVLMVGKIGGRPCYAVPCRVGAPLADLARDEGIELATRCGWIRALAGGLAAAHRRGIRLGNVRPEMVDFDRETGLLRYSHHVAHDPAWPSEALAAGRIPGEIARADAATDVYFWGLLSMWLLSRGAVPPPDEGPLTSAKLLCPDLADGLAETVDACLSTDPSRRPENGLYLVELLRAFPGDLASRGSAAASAADLRHTLGDIRRSGRVSQATPPPEAGPPPALSIDAVLAADERPGLSVRPRTLAALLVALVLLVAAFAPRGATPAATRVTPADPPGSAAWVPKRREHWEIRPLPASDQARYRADPRIRELLTAPAATPESFRATWDLLRSLVNLRVLPKPLDGWDRVLTLRATFKRDPPAGCRQLDAFLADLRVILGEPATR